MSEWTAGGPSSGPRRHRRRAMADAKARRTAGGPPAAAWFAWAWRPGLSCTLALLLLLTGGCAWYRDTFTVLPTTATSLRTIEPLDPAALPRTTAPAAESPTPATPVTPPATLRLTVEECRAAALAHNLRLQVVLIDPSVAAARVSEEEARFEAVFSTEVSHSSTDTPTTTVPTGTRAGGTQVQAGVEMPLRTGGTLRFDLADSRSTSDPDGASSSTSYTGDASMSISQPLLRNAGRRVNTHGIRLALYQHQVAQASTRLEIIRVLAAVDRVYWRLYASRRVLDVRRQDYELAQRQLETAQRLVAAGERAQVEVLRAESALASRLEGIISAENAVRDRQRELKRVINRPEVPLDSETILVPASEPDPVHYALLPTTLVAEAQRQRMELLELELELAQDDSTVEYLRNQLLPLVMLDYSYQVNGLGDSRWDAYDLLDSRRYTGHQVGVSLLVPLGNEAAESRLRQALLSRRQRLRTQDERQALIEQEVLVACDNLEATWQRILANRQTALLAERLLEAERRQFELGLNTSNDVLAAQAKLADAQSAEIAALTEYQIALVDLAYATGTVLGAARVQWQETP